MSALTFQFDLGLYLDTAVVSVTTECAKLPSRPPHLIKSTVERPEMSLRWLKWRGIGRLELLAWLNEFLETDYTKVRTLRQQDGGEALHLDLHSLVCYNRFVIGQIEHLADGIA